MNCPKHGCAMTETITDDIFCGVCERVRLNAEIAGLRKAAELAGIDLDQYRAAAKQETRITLTKGNAQ